MAKREPLDTGYGFNFDPEERPDWWLRAAQVFYQMIVHTQGHNPAKLLFLQRPNEDPDVLNFRLQNFESITMDAIGRAINSVLTPIGSAPFRVYLDDETQQYIDRPIFGTTHAYGTGYDYFQWIVNVAMLKVFNDPNGYTTWMPYGLGLTDNTVPVDCLPYQIYSVCITHLDGEYITFYRPEERFNLGDGSDGRMYYTITRDAYFRHKERFIEGEKKTTFDTELIYQHNIGEIPIVLNGGIRRTSIGQYDYKTRKALFGEKNYGSWMPYTEMGNGGGFALNNFGLPQFIDYYDSFFCGFVPYGNEALKCFDDWKASRLMTAHPRVVEKQMPCTAEGCDSGKIWVKKDEYHDCRSCGGSGSVMVRSPYGSYVVKVPDSTTLDNQTLVDDPISFVQPPVEGLRYMDESWQMLIKKASESVFQLFTDTAQSGEAKKVDREDKYSFVKKISDHAFDHIIYNHLWYLVRLRNIVNPAEPVVVKPESFMIRDEESLIEELKQLNESDAPVQVKIKAQKELVKRRYSGIEDASEMIDALVLFDPLYGKSIADIQLANISGAVAIRDWQKHMYADNIMYKLLQRNGIEWLLNDDAVILADMNAEFEAVVPAPPTQIQIPKIILDEEI